MHNELSRAMGNDLSGDDVVVVENLEKDENDKNDKNDK